MSSPVLTTSMCRRRTPVRVPSPQDLAAYKGGHTNRKWAQLPPHWRCPSCGRSKFEQLRWTKSLTGCGVAKGESQWLAPIHEHHDHGADAGTRPARFAATMLCFDCNNADGRAKRALSLPEDFSFAVEELRIFIHGIPHCGVDLDLSLASRIAECVLSASEFGFFT